MKRFLEMRGADGGRWSIITALPAFWTGLLYDQEALDGAWDLVKDWSTDERETLRNGVPVGGIRTPVPQNDRQRTCQRGAEAIAPRAQEPQPA